MRLLLAPAAALALGACHHTPEIAADGPAPVLAEEAAAEASDYQPPVMPTAEVAAKAIADAQAAAETGVVYAGYDRKGGEIALKVGDRLRIELESVPTAGYVWILGDAPAFMVPAGEGSRPVDPAHQNLPGFTGGNHYLSFDFLASAPGSGRFTLTEGRPWEAGEPAADTYELTVTAAE